MRKEARENLLGQVEDRVDVHSQDLVPHIVIELVNGNTRVWWLNTGVVDKNIKPSKA